MNRVLDWVIWGIFAIDDDDDDNVYDLVVLFIDHDLMMMYAVLAIHLPTSV